MKKECNRCHKEKIIQNKTKGLCGDCVYELNHNGKSRFEVAIEKQKSKSIKSYIIKRKSSKPYIRKSTGEKELFLEIWQEREHVCVNCKCYLGEEPKVHFFAHKTSKGADVTKRLDKNNIELNCFDCHFARDHQGIEAYNARKNER